MTKENCKKKIREKLIRNGEEDEEVKEFKIFHKNLKARSCGGEKKLCKS